MTPHTPPDNGFPVELQTKLKASLSSYCSTIIRPTVDVDKAVWNSILRKNEMYYRGLQHLTYGTTVTGGVEYVSITGQNTMGVKGKLNDTDDLYDYVLNVLQGDVDTFIAVLGGRSPNCQAQARDKSNESQIRLKTKADRVAAYLDSHWKVSQLHPQLMRGIALYGTMFSYTRYRINGRKYGIQQVPQFQEAMVPDGPAEYHCWNCGMVTEATQAQSLVTPDMPPDTAPCSQCGTPLGPEWLVQPDNILSLVPNGVLPMANGAVELSIYNPAHITVDMSAADMDYSSWGVLETSDDKGALVHAYPELRSKVYASDYSVDDTMGNVMGRYTRELITSPSNRVVNQQKSKWLHTQMWLAATAFEYLPGDRSGDLRQVLYDKYPDGAKVPMVNGEVLINRISNERMTSVLTACKPKPGEMIYCEPYFQCQIQMCDAVNDMLNMLREQAERSNPITVADPEILSPDYVRKYASLPGQFVFAKKGSVGSLDKGFFRVQAAELNETLISFIDKYIEWTRDITGIVPALFGGDSGGGDQTAYEANLKHNQAMMKLNPTWTQVRGFWAKTKENGIYQAAKYSDGALYSANQQGVVEVQELDNIGDLNHGGWYMEAEESMPQSIGERRNWLMNTLKLPPETQNLLGVSEPGNIVKIQETVGMSDWVVPGFDQIMRLHDVITKLLPDGPIPGQPGPPDPMTGQPGPTSPDQPTVPFNDFLFDPSLAVKALREWLLSERGAQLEGTPGYQNVLAYAMSAKAAMPPQNPPEKVMNPVTSSITDYTPDVQQMILGEAGIKIPPGVPIAVPPPQPKLESSKSQPMQHSDINHIDNSVQGPPLHKLPQMPPAGGIQ